MRRSCVLGSCVFGLSAVFAPGAAHAEPVSYDLIAEFQLASNTPANRWSYWASLTSVTNVGNFQAGEPVMQGIDRNNVVIDYALLEDTISYAGLFPGLTGVTAWSGGGNVVINRSGASQAANNTGFTNSFADNALYFPSSNVNSAGRPTAISFLSPGAGTLDLSFSGYNASRTNTGANGFAVTVNVNDQAFLRRTDFSSNGFDAANPNTFTETGIAVSAGDRINLVIDGIGAYAFDNLVITELTLSGDLLLPLDAPEIPAAGAFGLVTLGVLRLARAPSRVDG